jgi:cobalamin biosynthesis protein CbiG
VDGDQIVIRAIGIGCSSSATPNEILAFLRGGLLDLSAGFVVATLDRRSEIIAPVARALGARMITFSSQELAVVRDISLASARCLATLGTSSVAEAAALAAAGEGSRLIVPRQSGARCTYALAEAT